MKTKILTLLVFSAFAFFACQKNDTSSTADQTTSILKSATIVTSDVAVQSASLETSLEADFYAGYERILRQLAHIKGKRGDLLRGQGAFHYIEGETPTVSIDTAAAGYPITIVIDYGDGVETDHGKVIKGKVTVVINGDKNIDGSTRAITYENCAVDTISINGTSNEKFVGDNVSTRKIVSSSDVTFAITDGATFVRKGDETKEWLAGVGTPKDPSDDKVIVTGSVNVNNTTDNILYSKTITNGLIKLGDCRYIVSGTVEYSQAGSVIGTLDYGDGTCDNIATLAVGGTTTEVTLKGPGKGHSSKDHSGGTSSSTATGSN
jgi:hypothetical protein